MRKSYSNNAFDQDAENYHTVLGSLIGFQKPKYDVLNETLGPFVHANPIDGDVVLFINLTSLLRKLYSDYAMEKLTRSELQRNKNLLTAEILNLVGHYRNYLYKHCQASSSIALYYSSEPCNYKMGVIPEYKEVIYNKRLYAEAAGGVRASVAGYVKYNLDILKALCPYIPNVYLIDTKSVDPEALPAAMINTGRAPGAKVVISSFDTDLQYALNDNTCVLRASGDNTKVITKENLFEYVLSKAAKTFDDTKGIIRPEHFKYALALIGDENFGVAGIPKVGFGKAVKTIAKYVKLGRLTADHPTDDALLAECEFSDFERDNIRKAWKTLIHDDYAPRITESELAQIDSYLLNNSSFGQLERANNKYFSDNPISLAMIFAGEGGF